MTVTFDKPPAADDSPADEEVHDEGIVDAELLDPDDPGPNPPEPEPDPSLIEVLFTKLTALIGRQVHHTRTGGRILLDERMAWLGANNLTDDYLRTHYLNARYTRWKRGQETLAENLEEKAQEHAKNARSARSRGQREGITAEDAKHAQTAAQAADTTATSLQNEAASFRRQIYVGHIEPSAAVLANHRRRVAWGRRTRAAVMTLIVGWAGLRFAGGGTALLGALGVTLTAWGKGKFVNWRTPTPDPKPLEYEPPALEKAPAGSPAASASPAAASSAAGVAPGAERATAEAAAGPAQGDPAPGAEATPGAPGDANPADPAAAAGEAVVYDEVVAFNAALAAAEILTKARNAPGVTVVQAPDYSIGNGHTMVLDLPSGSGKLVRHVLKKIDVIAGDLAIPATRLVVREVAASEGGHGRRMHVWVAEQDPYLAIGHAISRLVVAESWDFWEGTPLGRNILSDLRDLPTEFAGGFTSHFYSGIMRFGKTAAMRLAVGAALLDVGVRLYLANGKSGVDWKPVRPVAHRFIEGTDEAGLAAFEDLLEELTDDMNDRYRRLGELDLHLAPEGRLTPELARKHGMPVLLGVFDELQLYLLAMSPKRREAALDKLKNLLRAGPAAGVFLIVGTQRPDGEEIPTGFRDLFGVRVSVRCLDSRSSRMCLGDLASDAGANASVLTKDHVGIVIAATGDEWEIISADFLSIEEFADLCAKARQLRLDAGTLTGDAAGEYRVTESRPVRAVNACLAVMEDLGTDRARVETLAAELDGEFEGIDKKELGNLLREAGCGNVTSIGAVDGQKNASGYRRAALESALAQD
jgi:S-DNA-T family DNA segregation ATPase FtsK/SpoIIIE